LGVQLGNWVGWCRAAVGRLSQRKREKIAT